MSFFLVNTLVSKEVLEEVNWLERMDNWMSWNDANYKALMASIYVYL